VLVGGDRGRTVLINALHYARWQLVCLPRLRAALLGDEVFEV
jgi:hypothetical protein